MIKPLDLLVVVGSTYRYAYTTTLSTGWSTRDLSLVLRRDGITHLEAGFPLRCFQWLSLPDIATRQCHWRDNRYTRGPSILVLSY